MSARMCALLLRLAAVELTGEAGGPWIRRTLRDLGLDDAAIDRAVARVLKAIRQ